MIASDSNISELETLAKPTDQSIKMVDTRQPETKPKIVEESENGKEQEDQEKEDEEEEGECGFCLFMKAGGCKDSFVAWEKCIEEAEKNKEDIAEKCFEVTGALKKCMEAHSDYYEPILKAEKVATEEATKELEKETEEQNVGSLDSEKTSVAADNQAAGS